MGVDASGVKRELRQARARIVELESWIADVLSEMRREHDKGDGHFSTEQVANGEKLIGNQK